LNEVVNFSQRGIHSVYLALGSNISPEINIPKAISNLNILFPSLRHSSAWMSPPSSGDGPDFINVIVKVYSSFSIEELKEDVLSPIENTMGRIRTEDKNSPRTIDIDIVLYNDQIIDPEVVSQPYLSVPLAEIYPSFQVDQFQTIEDISKNFLISNKITPRKEVLYNNLMAS